VLVNGRRFVSGVPGDTAVDLNTIPDRLHRARRTADRWRFGNLRFGRRGRCGQHHPEAQLEGVTVDASTGKSDKNDDFKKKAITFGTTSADGGSNIMGHFGYSKQGAVMSKDRPGLGAAVDQIPGYAVTGDAKDAYTRPSRTTRALRRKAASSPRAAALHLRQERQPTPGRPTAPPPPARPASTVRNTAPSPCRPSATCSPPTAP
jgi:hypothetical protein